MKLKELIELKNDFSLVDDVKCNFKFAYAVAKNKKKVKALIEEFEAPLIPNDKYSEYEEKRIKMAQKYAKKDENGQPVSKNSFYVIDDENKVKFEKELAELKELYKEEIDAYEIIQKGYFKALNENIEIEFHELEESDIPDLTPKQMDIVLNFIK